MLKWIVFATGTILYIFLSCGTSVAQKLNLKFTHFNSEHGLNSPKINCIQQDDLGFLWLGTGNGLHRFDGYEFKPYFFDKEDSTSLSSNSITTLYKDNNGKLWVGTRNGLNLFDPELDKFIRFRKNKTQTNSLSDNYIRGVVQDSLGNYWIATDNGGINYFSPKANHFEHYVHQSNNTNSIPSNRVRSICLDSKGKLWIGTQNKGISRMDTQTKTFVHFADSLSGNNINHITETSDGKIWIGTYSSGISVYDPISGTFTQHNKQHSETGYIAASAKQIHEDSRGIVWAVSWDKGLFRYDPQTGKFSNYVKDPDDRYSLSDTRLLSIGEDNSGMLWVGAYRGLNATSVKPSPFEHVYHKKNEPNSLPDDIVYGIDEDSLGRLWISTYNKGICFSDETGYIYTSPTFNKKVPKNFARNTAWDVTIDSKGRVWIGKTGGLLRYNMENRDYTLYPGSNPASDGINANNILSVTEDFTGKLWLSSWNGGLICFDPETEKAKNYKHNPNDPWSLAHNSIVHVFEDSKQNLWVITGGNNLYLYDRQTDRFVLHLSDDNPIGRDFKQVLEDNNGQLWLVCTGLMQAFDFRGNIRQTIKLQYQKKDIYCMSVLEDKNGNFWIASTNGIFKYNRKLQRIFFFDKDDGVLRKAFTEHASYKGKDGRLYFGGNEGYNVFHPDSVVVNSFLPPIRFTNFLLSNQVVKIGDESFLQADLNLLPEITLDHTDKIFSFEFAALNFHQPNKNAYAYKMEGISDDWIYTDAKNRRATFTGLPHGTYTFKVKASNNDNVWNKKPIAVKVTILPPWWLTWWAKTLAAILVIGTTFVIIRERLARLNKHKRVLEKKVAERTSEIQTQAEEIQAQAEELKTINDRLLELDSFKQGMTGMIVHDLKNPLNAIINTPESNAAKGLKRIKQSGREMLNMVLNILDVYKYEETKLTVDKVDCLFSRITKKALEEVAFLIEQKNLNIVNNIPSATGIKGDSEILQRVMVNLLTNAIKYTPANNSIHLETSETPNGMLRIVVSDTGQGIPQDQLTKVFNKFSQVEAQKSGNVRSTGLGLTFCKLAVEAHGGEIGVESEIDKGSRFYFTLVKSEQKVNEDAPVLQTEADNTGQLCLSDEDQNFLTPHVRQLEQLLVYETSLIEGVLVEMDIENERIEKWKAELKDCLYSMNETKYQELISLAKKP